MPKTRGPVVEGALESQLTILRDCVTRYLQILAPDLGGKESPTMPARQDFNESWWAFAEESGEARSALS